MNLPLPAHPRRVIVAAIAVIVLALLAAGPLRGLRSDIAQQKVDVDAQRAIVGKQLGTTREQLGITRDQLSITKKQLAIASEQLELARKQGRITEATYAKIVASLDIQRELLAIARQTLAEVKELNKKVPPPS